MTPAPSFSSAPSAGPITATFSEALTAGSVDTTSFVVHSSMRGRLFDANDVVLSNGNLTATFQPDLTFFPGETVFATLTTGIEAASGTALWAGYVWQFTGEVSPASPGCFLPVDVSAGGNAYMLALGDVDGDGHLDLVSGEFINSPNRLYLWDAVADTFKTETLITGDANSTQAGDLGDVDGDGDLDLVVGNNAATSVKNRLYLWDAVADTFMTGTDIGSETENTYVSLFGDVDGDGDLDLVVANPDSHNRLYLWRPVRFLRGNAVHDYGRSDVCRRARRCDRDGDLDFIAANNNQKNRLHRWDTATNSFDAGTDIGRETDADIGGVRRC